MNVYQHATESRTFFAPDREPTPDLAFQLWHVGGLDNYATPKPMFTKADASTGSEASSRTLRLDPALDNLSAAAICARRTTAAGGTLTGAGQSVGLFEFIGTDLVDLTTYYTNAGQTNNVPVTLKSVDTQSTLCKEPNCDDTEQTLDMTQASAWRRDCPALSCGSELAPCRAKHSTILASSTAWRQPTR